MREVSHANPYTNKTVGQLFSRGPTAVTDGGEPSEARRAPEDESSGSERSGDGSRSSSEAGTDPNEDTEPESQRMRDVEHTPPHDADDANRVFERGREPTPADRQPTVSEE